MKREAEQRQEIGTEKSVKYVSECVHICTHREKWHNVFTYMKSRCKSSPATQQFPVPLAPPAHFSFQHAKYFDRRSIFTPLRLALIDFHGVRWSGRACVG